MRRMSKPRVPKVKSMNYRLVERETEIGKQMYALMGDILGEHHKELIGARIAIAWSLKWKPDVDGVTKLGQLKKASELDRELAAWDFVMVLRQEFFQNPAIQDFQKSALIDHELCHATVALDQNGEPKIDGRGRKVYRTRKHDIQEFTAVVERHGFYTRDLERFFSAMKRAPKQGELFAMETKPPEAPLGPRPVPGNGNGKANGHGKESKKAVTKPGRKGGHATA